MNRIERGARGLRIVSAVVAIGWSTAVAAQPPPAKAAPRVSCEVTQGDGVELRSGQPARVSNLKAIPLKAVFTGVEILPGAQVRSASDAATTTSSLAIEVRMAGAGGNDTVPIRIAQNGSGQTIDEYHLSFVLGIPIDDTDRDAQALQYVEWLASNAEKEIPPVDPMILNVYKNRKAWPALGHAFDRVFFESRVGLFDVTCTYVSKVPGSFNGEIRAAPVRIDVVFAGHFFDQPELRKR